MPEQPLGALEIANRIAPKVASAGVFAPRPHPRHRTAPSLAFLCGPRRSRAPRRTRSLNRHCEQRQSGAATRRDWSTLPAIASKLRSGRRCSAAQVAAVEADHDRGRHHFASMSGSGASAGRSRAIRSPTRWVRLRTVCAGVYGTADEAATRRGAQPPSQRVRARQTWRSHRQARGPSRRRASAPKKFLAHHENGDIGTRRIAEL